MKTTHEQRMEIFEEGGTLMEMAEKAGMTSGGFGRWMHDNHLKSRRKKEENDRRMQEYRKGHPPKETADALGLTLKTYEAWRYRNSLSPSFRAAEGARGLCNIDPAIASIDFTEARKERVRRFFRDLKRCAGAMPNQKITLKGITDFMAEWIKLYGTEGEVLEEE